MKRRTKTRPFRGTLPASGSVESTSTNDAQLAQAPSQRSMAARLPLASWRSITLAAGLIVLAGLAAYHNTVGVPFIYDEATSIVENQTIRRLWPISQPLCPPRGGETVTGRPLLNLSFALNYALGGLEVQGYHAANLAIHIAAALVLFGVLRRTFLTPPLRERFGRAAAPLALASALFWMVHPLQTESVTYIVQRAESLMGLFYLLTLYCVIRGADSARPRFWHVIAVIACLLGMATKEVMVTAPLIVLLYDRTFLAGSFSEAWRRRWLLYTAVAATWGLLAYLVLSTALIGRQADLGAPDVWSYARTQPGVILHYLRLSVWPNLLCFDYAWPTATSIDKILAAAMVVGLLLAATIWGLMQRKAYGFVGAWFFVILVPTSSILPLRQLAQEHRLYLSLAAVAALVVTGGYALWLRMLTPSHDLSHRLGSVQLLAAAAMFVAALLGLGFATVVRNSAYRSALTIWQDTVAKRPGNPVAHNNLAACLAQEKRMHEAIQQLHEALRLKPEYAEAHYNLGNVLALSGSMDEAIEQFREAVRLKPDYVRAQRNLGNALADSGRTDEAIDQYSQLLQQTPDSLELLNNLAWLVATRQTPQAGSPARALQLAQRACNLSGPGNLQCLDTLAAAYAAAGRFDDAIITAERAIQLAESTGQTALAQRIRSRLELYRAGRPWREAAVTR